MRRNYHRKLWKEIITGNYEEKLSQEIMRRNYYRQLWGEIITKNYPENLQKSHNIKECLYGEKEGGREGYRERVREIEGNRDEMESERKRNTHTWGSINGQSIRGMVGLTLKLDELLGPSMTLEVILI